MFALAVALVLLAFTCACPFIGRFLVVEDDLAPADAIVVLAGSRVSRWMEALELYRAGIGSHVVLSSDIMEGAEFRLVELGINLPRHSDLVREAMIKLGVPADRVEVFTVPVDNTAQEAAVTRALARDRGWTHVLVVTSKYHTRRTRFAFHREFRGSNIEIHVRGTRYDRIDPWRWWMHRYDARWVSMELPKLIAYALGLEG